MRLKIKYILGFGLILIIFLLFIAGVKHHSINHNQKRFNEGKNLQYVFTNKEITILNNLLDNYAFHKDHEKINYEGVTITREQSKYQGIIIDIYVGKEFNSIEGIHTFFEPSSSLSITKDIVDLYRHGKIESIGIEHNIFIDGEKLIPELIH